MTKITDLVTEIADGVLDAYPIDTERYELCVYLNQELNAAFGRQRELIQITDPDLQEQYELMEDYLGYALACTSLKLSAPNARLPRKETVIVNRTLRVPDIRQSFDAMVNVEGRLASEWCVYSKYSVLSLVYRKLMATLEHLGNGPKRTGGIQ